MKRGKGTKIMTIADASAFPVAAHIESAFPHEVKLVDKTIDKRFLNKAPDDLIGRQRFPVLTFFFNQSGLAPR